MPSALETLVKILKLERDQGGKNTAVVGGLSAYAANWQPQAREQARRARHHILIDEIVDALTEYDRIASEDERIDKVNYLLNRVTDRQKAPPKYQQRLAEWERNSARGKIARLGRSAAARRMSTSTAERRVSSAAAKAGASTHTTAHHTMKTSPEGPATARLTSRLCPA